MSQKRTYILFTSDHGELLNERGIRGHGWFEEEVYQVPFLFIQLNDSSMTFQKNLQFIDSHFDMSNLITGLLGYKAPLDTNFVKEIYVNGSDIDGLAGYMHIRLEGGKVINREIAGRGQQ